MKVEIRFPPDVKVDFDKGKGLLTLTPVFYAGGRSSRQELYYATAVGEAGGRADSVGYVNGNNGLIESTALATVRSKFDEAPPPTGRTPAFVPTPDAEE